MITPILPNHMHPRRTPPAQTAFTLIELLVVITIVGILVAIALPIIGRVQQKGYETKTLSNMRQMGVALMTYANDNSYQLPGRDPTGDKWTVVLRPYVQDLNVYGSPIPDVKGVSYKVTDPTLYVSPNVNYSSYIYNGGNEAAQAGATNPTVTFPRLNVIGQPSQTILLGVPLPQKNNWYMDFNNGDNDTVLNLKAFPDGTPYVFADGSARTLTAMTATQVGQSSASNKAEPVGSGTYTDWLWLFDKSRTDIIP